MLVLDVWSAKRKLLFRTQKKRREIQAERATRLRGIKDGAVALAWRTLFGYPWRGGSGTGAAFGPDFRGLKRLRKKL
jgi:hypothetical protein